ncbi:MAG: cytochrome ubiquinol oxidase subunit I, partial [Desulfuromonadales bacterium]|nr:cytochrome ubiquinol oxidase subunit I [Desulfuromonadales bacterium]
MNYPVWYLPDTGGGLLIAFIAIVHVFISHFAVGGGLYLVMAERKGLRENSPEILEFTRKHAKFFMLVSMVFGGITGVGIWFIIALVQPAAVSMLIHTFVYGWAAEWVWFLVEIVALMVYYYTFGKMDSRTHQKVGWIYFIAAWLSLFLINGIIGFMLTPGGWLEDHNFWTGLFNPSFWPALFVRSFIAFTLAGLYAFVTCAFLKDRDLKIKMTRYSGKWALGSLLLALPSAWWYIS